MLELAGALLSTLGSGSAAAMSGVSIPAPLLLNAAQPGTLSASVQPQSGALSVWTQGIRAAPAVHLGATAAAAPAERSSTAQPRHLIQLLELTARDQEQGMPSTTATATVLPGPQLQVSAVLCALVRCSTSASIAPAQPSGHAFLMQGRQRVCTH